MHNFFFIISILSILTAYFKVFIRNFNLKIFQMKKLGDRKQNMTILDILSHFHNIYHLILFLAF